MWNRRPIERVLVHAALLLVAVTTLAPFLWMIFTSLKMDENLFKVPPDLLPIPLNTANYPAVFAKSPMLQALYNSAKIAVLATAGTLLTSSLAAYAFAKIQFPQKKALFVVFLATLMIPGQVTLIPFYILMSKIGWLDTHLPLIVPGMLVNAYGVFLLRQFMEGIPTTYVESAKIDGASHIRIWWSIMLPMCKPPLLTLGLFSFIGNWNNFLGPLIFLSSKEKFTVPLVVSSFRSVYYAEWGLLMAAAAMAVLPVVVLYLIAQRYFVEGVTLSGLKG